jgi:ketosteroid isomerase-like protein
MKIILTLATLVAVATFSLGQKAVPKTDELIKRLDGKLTAALLKGDVATVDTMITDDYIEIDAQGLVRHKPDVMASVRAQASAPPSISIGPETRVDETNVRIHGDSAILTSLTTTKYQHMEYQTVPGTAQLPAPSATDQYRLMKVYSKHNGRWQLIASQTTAIAKH